MSPLFFMLPFLQSNGFAPLNLLAPNPAAIVTVYYETLCPYCQKFLPEKLEAAYNDRNLTALFSDLNLIPYGLVKVINASTHHYECHHGQAECEGNMLHSCAIKYITDKKLLLTYISCLELSTSNKNVSLEYPVTMCQDKVPENILLKVMNCYNTSERWELFKRNGVLTKNFFRKGKAFLPYVSFNHVKSDHFAIKAVQDFRKTLCAVTQNKNDFCST